MKLKEILEKYEGGDFMSLTIKERRAVIKEVLKRYKKARRKRKKVYGEDVLNALIYLWYISDYICGMRLRAYIGEALPNLKKFREIDIDKDKRIITYKTWDSARA